VADLRAFPGYRYDVEHVGSLSEVVAPPYDVLSEAQVAEYKARSPYNVVHLTRPGADYAGAATRLGEWQREGVLGRDEPAMYLHEVSWGGHRRRDLVAALRLEPYSSGQVLPHERTHRGPKEDRLALLRATGFSLEPLWFLYDGAQSELPGLLDERFAHAADLEFELAGGDVHRWWTVRDPHWIARVAAAARPQPVLIADGHHRYETTLAYSEEVAGDSPDAASRFTPALLTDMRDPGLVVLPTHRMLRAGVKVTGGVETGSLSETLAALHGRVAAGVYAGGRFQVIDFDEGDVPVVELHRQVIDNILGRRNPEDFLSYTRDAREAVSAVDSGAAATAFFLAPPQLPVVLAKAREGMTMPQKTTYFDPKPPSGMVFHHLDPKTELGS
jgi:uncharacterized protein (DUF1015 family)